MTTKSSGKKHNFKSGAFRDSQEGKDRFDLIPIKPLKRLAKKYADGAELYGEFNWVKGQDFSRVYASMFRHLLQWREGQTDEDHLAALAWGAFALMHYEETNRKDLNDLEEL